MDIIVLKSIIILKKSELYHTRAVVPFGVHTYVDAKEAVIHFDYNKKAEIRLSAFLEK